MEKAIVFMRFNKKLRDPNAPKRNMSTYILYQNAMRETNKGQVGTLIVCKSLASIFILDFSIIHNFPVLESWYDLWPAFEVY